MAVTTLWLVAAALLVAVLWLLLGACGVALGERRLSFCPTDGPAPDPELARQTLLEREIHRLELALLQRPACPAAPPPLPPAPPVEEPPPVEGPAVDKPPMAQAAPPEPRPPGIPVPKPEPPPPPPEPPPAPAQPPPPADDRLHLPDRLDPGDLAFLEGCWETDPFRHAPSHPLAVSRYCFDREGRGSLEFRNPQRTCRAPARIEVIPPRGLRIRDADTTCSDGTPWSQDRLDCEAGADGAAVCRGEANNPAWPFRIERWRVNLHRAP